MDKRVLVAILAAVIVGSIGAYWYWGLAIKKPFTLRYGYPPYADSAPLYVAVEKGFFEEEKLNVSLTKFFTGPKIIEAAAAGNLDGGFVMIIAALEAFQGGVDLKLAAGVSYYDKEHDPMAVVVRTDSPIQSVGDLKGKTISEESLGARSIILWEVLLPKHGLTLEDVNIVVIQSESDQLEAVTAGRVDAASITEPFLTPALESGEIRIISRTFSEIFPGHTFPMASTFFLKNFIDEHKDVVDAFIRAYHKAVDWINDHPIETREIIARWTGIDPELTKKMALQAFSKQLDSEGVKRIVNLMLEYGYLEEGIRIEDIMYQG